MEAGEARRSMRKEFHFGIAGVDGDASGARRDVHLMKASPLTGDASAEAADSAMTPSRPARAVRDHCHPHTRCVDDGCLLPRDGNTYSMLRDVRRFTSFRVHHARRVVDFIRRRRIRGDAAFSGEHAD